MPNTKFDNNLKSSDIHLRIGILGHYGNKNIGDEAIIAATIKNFTDIEPKVCIRCFSINPLDTQERHKVPSFPIRYLTPTKSSIREARNYTNESEQPKNNGKNSHFSLREKLTIFFKSTPLVWLIAKLLKRIYHLTITISQEIRFCYSSYQTAKDLHLLVVAGSNQFLDNFGGPWGFPYTLFKWAIIAKIAGAKLSFVSVGAGPLDSFLSKCFVNAALFFSNYTSFRDQPSKKLIESIGFSGKSYIFPDLAHSLPFKKAHTKSQSSLRPIVGINPMPVYDRRYWCQANDSKYSKYVSKMARLVELLLKNGQKVFFFNTMPKDLLVIDDIINILKQRFLPEASVESILTVKECHTVAGLMETIISADVIIATRFHGVVLSLLAEKPVMGICYHQKTEALLKDSGQGDYAVDLDSFDVELLHEKYQKLSRNLSQETYKIYKRRKEIVPALQQQYSSLINIAKESKKWKKDN